MNNKASGGYYLFYLLFVIYYFARSAGLSLLFVMALD